MTGTGAGAADRALDVLDRRGIRDGVEIALVLGTGLGAVAEAIEDATVVPYAALPGFPSGGVTGHAARLVVGRWRGARVAVLQGRAHFYEVGAAAAMAVPLAVLARLGATILVLTNSAGSIRPEWAPGSLVLLADHINLSGLNPLVGTTGDGRFVSMTGAYDPDLRRALRRAAEAAGIAVPPEGVYMWFPGPSFETPAEIRAARALGADLAGMSTVPEVILARRLGLRVAAVSVVTNLAAGIEGADPSHADTKAVAAAGAADLARLLGAFMGEDRDA